jgi:hypothetical protein
MTDAQRAKEWLEGEGYSVVDAIAVSGHYEPYWSVMPSMAWTNQHAGMLKDPELRFHSDAELIAFAKEKGWEHDPD